MDPSAALEEERKQCQEQLNIVTGQLHDDPGNPELAALKGELSDLIALLDENISEIQGQQASKPAPPEKKPSPAPQSENWSKDNNQAFKKSPAQVEDRDDAVVTYQVNDTVMAKWVSGDKAFYPARITSITGSSTAPIYIVKFKSYDNTDTLRSRDIKPMSNKRKADASAASITSPAPENSAPGVVTSAGATVYAEAKREAEKGADPAKPPKAKKIKANKELEAGKNKWQEFNSKSKFGKKSKKDSMFRTPDGVHGRVGFTGSGQAMRKDPTRSRHVYQMNEELD